ncbi:MAG: NUDIX hydrolase [Candidatus Saccharimonadales bacterium]
MTTELRTVAKAILVRGDRILLLRRSDTDDRRPLQWDLPGGMVDAGEDLKAACVREVHEEAGISITIDDCKTAFAMTESVTETMYATFVFFIAKAEGEVTLSYEHCEAAWMTLDEAIDAIEYERHRRVLVAVRDGGLLSATTTE